MAKEKTKKQVKKELQIKQVKNRLHMEKGMALFGSAFEARERYDWEWLTRDLFRRGYQFSSYDANTKTVLLASKRGVKFPINLLWAQMRSVKNQVTSFKPKWEVLPAGKSEDAVSNAKYSGRLLDYYYRRLGLRKKIKEVVMQGLMFSVGGPWQIGYDSNADQGRGEVYIWQLDTYDFYVDPMATSLEDAEYCGKAVRKTLSELTTNPEFNFIEDPPERGDSIIAASPTKQFLLQSLKYKVPTAAGQEEEESAILKEIWIKTRVSEDNMEDMRKELAENDQDNKDLKEGEILMRVIHYVDFIQDPLKVQLKRTDQFPFVMYQADINPVELYGESWAKHIIPINRVLNALESSIFTYNYRYAIGRIVLDKNSGVRVVTNQHGDFIEKNRGAEVTSLPLQPLPSSYRDQIANCWKYIEDLGGAHDATMGRIPTGVTSGIGIAELKQADSTNSADLVDNLEDFLVKVGQKILAVISENYSVPKVIKDLGMGGDAEHFAVVGEGGAKRRKNKKEVKIGVDKLDLAVIGNDNEIRVTIGSWLAYTKTARQERIKELFNSGLIDQKTALQHLEFSDIDTITENTRKAAILQQFQGQTAEGEEVADEEIARQENLMMTQEGRQVPVQITDNHTVHNIIHQEVLGSSGNEIVEAHMTEHSELASEAPPAGAVEAGGSPQTLPGPAQGVGGPVGPQTPPTSQQLGPEEAALSQTLEEMGGV